MLPLNIIFILFILHVYLYLNCWYQSSIVKYLPRQRNLYTLNIPFFFPIKYMLIFMLHPVSRKPAS